MAAVAASYVQKLLDGTCTWMTTYVDMDGGFLQCIPADPPHVAQTAGLHINAVVKRTNAYTRDTALAT